MMQSPESSFLKKYYPLILIAIGGFLLLFPFGLINGLESLFFVWLIGGLSVLVVGVLLYYKKRTTYSQSLRKKMKIAGILCIVILIAIPLAGVVLGVVVGINNVLYDPSSLPQTEMIDPILFETKIVDWVNVNRAKNNVGGVNLDDKLNRLAEIRSLDISLAPADQAQFISDLDVNEIAIDNNLECVIDSHSTPIHEYSLQYPHTKFRTIEDLADYLMKFLIEQGNEKEKVFASNMTRTGISVSMNDDYLFVVQNFC